MVESSSREMIAEGLALLKKQEQMELFRVLCSNLADEAFFYKMDIKRLLVHLESACLTEYVRMLQQFPV